MTPAARLQATLDLLTEIEKTPRPADALASAYFRARRYIGSHDRGAISVMLYDILRHHARLGWWIDKNGGENNPRAQVIAYLALVEKKPSRQIEPPFSGGKFAPAAMNEAEKKLLRAFDGYTIEHSDMPDEVQAECPAWAAGILKTRFGKDFMREMRALLEPAPLDLRVNQLKTTREEMLTALKQAGIKAEPGKLSKLAIRVRERPNLAALSVLKQGLLEIQDEGSQLVAALLDAKPGERVADFCAGAGGKTLAIAAQMQNKGRITACDVLEKRLARSTERFRRAGVHNIETKPIKDERDPWVKKHKGDFDRVLVDAPCTGTGTWRRNPDARWRGEEDARLQALGPGLEALVKLQAEILDSAARLVKPGGRLVYATCSLLPEENEKQIERFLATHADFRVIPYSETLTGIRSAHPDYLMLTPAKHGTDGFFAAAMERNRP